MYWVGRMVGNADYYRALDEAREKKRVHVIELDEDELENMEQALSDYEFARCRWSIRLPAGWVRVVEHLADCIRVITD